MTVLTAGVASPLWITARDAFANIVTGPLSWLHGPTSEVYAPELSMDESRAGAFIATVAGSYSHQVQLVQSGSLSATFYSDAAFGTPVLTSQAATSLGDLSDPLIQAAIEDRPEYFSVRWAGYLRPSVGSVFTFLADPAAAQRLVIGTVEVLNFVPGGSGL
ncbi:hypothetical protein T484DRAFT_1905153, partial [Baffinella frigidus]